MTKPRILLGLLILGLVFSFSNSSAQEKRWSIRSSLGTASGNTAVDGFYLSFDLGIPLTKSLELSPIFNFFSTVPLKRIDNSWNEYGPNYTVIDGDKNQYSGDMMGSMSVVLLFKPLALSDNPKLAKHELAIGTGIGVKTYATVRSTYVKTGTDYRLTELGAKSAWTIEPYYAKVFYNYHFSERFFAGPVASIDGFDGEAVALFGIQLGLNINPKVNQD